MNEAKMTGVLTEIAARRDALVNVLAKLGRAE